MLDETDWRKRQRVETWLAVSTRWRFGLACGQNSVLNKASAPYSLINSFTDMPAGIIGSTCS